MRWPLLLMWFMILYSLVLANSVVHVTLWVELYVLLGHRTLCVWPLYLNGYNFCYRFPLF